MTTRINQKKGHPMRVGHRLVLAEVRELLADPDVASVEYVRADGHTEAVFAPRREA